MLVVKSLLRLKIRLCGNFLKGKGGWAYSTLYKISVKLGGVFSVAKATLELLLSVC